MKVFFRLQTQQKVYKLLLKSWKLLTDLWKSRVLDIAAWEASWKIIPQQLVVLPFIWSYNSKTNISNISKNSWINIENLARNKREWLFNDFRWDLHNTTILAGQWKMMELSLFLDEEPGSDIWQMTGLKISYKWVFSNVWLFVRVYLI